MKTGAFFCGIVLILISHTPSDASDRWLSVGVGAGSLGLAGMACGSLQLSPHTLISARYSMVNESKTINENDDFFSGGEQFKPGVADFGVLFGYLRSIDSSKATLTVSVGLGQATVTTRGEFLENDWIFRNYWAKKVSRTTAVLLQAQLFGRKWGVQAFGDFNSIFSFGGMVISYRFLGTNR